MSSKFYSSDYQKEELLNVVEDESDVVSFCSLLEQVRNLGNHSVDKRQKVLTDLVFWKAQFNRAQKEAEEQLQVIKAIEYKKAYEKLKIVTKPTDAQVKAEMDAREMSAREKNLTHILMVAEKYNSILSDAYFISSTTHKIMGKDF